MVEDSPSSGPAVGGILGPQSGLLTIIVTKKYFSLLSHLFAFLATIYRFQYFCENLMTVSIMSWHLTVVSWLMRAQRLPSARAILNKPTIGMHTTEEKVMHHPTVFAQSG